MGQTDRDEVLREYYACQDRIMRYDQQLVAVKSLGTMASGALLTLAFSKGSELQPKIFLLAAFAAMVFMYIEAEWKSFQIILVRHATELESTLHHTGDYQGPTINGAYASGHRFLKRLWRLGHASTYMDVWLPHAPIILVSLWLSAPDTAHALANGIGQTICRWIELAISFGQHVVGGL